jgi:TRAP-type mannitol/chloroaromatic compound transport system substrate-binding protein
MDKDTLIQFRKTTHDYVEKMKQKYPDVKKIVDSQQAWEKDFVDWRKARGRVVPWPYEMYISGIMTQ